MKKILSLFLLLSLVSCEGVVLGKDASEDATVVFEHLWQDVHDRYAYFTVKDIDWHEVKGRYQPRVRDGMPEKELFNVLAEMLFELRDGHVNLTSDFDRSRNWEWFQDYPMNYNQGIVDRHYLGRDFWITGPLLNQVIDGVLYVNYRSFLQEISQAHLDELMERTQGVDGVIIDVRSNFGGSSVNMSRLASSFTDETYRYGSLRIKNGPCADCFSSWIDMNISPRNGARFSGKVVVLTNRESYSSTTWFAEAMRRNPQVTLVGAPTGGGAGTPVYGELPNGWTYRFSASQVVNVEGEHLEGGVPVDIEVALLPEDERENIDTIIEYALGLFD